VDFFDWDLPFKICKSTDNCYLALNVSAIIQ
jgi:hypothetical protein